MSHTRTRIEPLVQLLSESTQFMATPYELIASTILKVIESLVNAPCFGRKDGVATQRFVKSKYNARKAKAGDLYAGYDPRLVARLSREAMTAAAEQGGLAPLQAHELALKTLDAIRLGDTDALSLTIEEMRGATRLSDGDLEETTSGGFDKGRSKERGPASPITIVVTSNNNLK